ncbi:MAG: AI-2E family transporter [Phycisphaerales bacterium]|jgi:predicted PurR-regulated permease PerM
MAAPQTNQKPLPSAGPPVDDWRTRHLWEIQPVRDGLVVASVVGLVYLGFKLSFVTVPILLALTLAYLFEPLVRRITRTRLVGRAPVAFGIIVVAALVVGVPVVVGGIFGISQGAKLVQTVARNVDAVSLSIQNPDDRRAKALVSRGGRAWSSIRDYIVKQQAILKAHEARQKDDAKSLEEAARAADSVNPDAPKEQVPGATQESNPTAPKENSTPTDDRGDKAAPSNDQGNQKSQPPNDQQARQDTADVPENPPESTASEHTLQSLEEAPSDVYRLLDWGLKWVQENAGSLSKNVLNVSGGAAAAALGTVTSIGRFLFGAFLTAFFFFFFCNGYGQVLQFWEGLIPERKKSRVVYLAGKMDRVIAGFVRGRLTISAILIGYYSLAYWLAGVPAPLILGPIVGVLTIVPYAATTVGIPLSMLFLWLEPGGGFQAEWWWIVSAPIGVSMLAQGLDDYVLTPKIQGDATDMDTPSILFASIAGGLLAGFYGILLAIPIAACVKILIKELVWPRFKEWSAGRASDPLPIGGE